jgi:hypothetical protein
VLTFTLQYADFPECPRFLPDLLQLQLQIREEWELEQKKQKEVEEEERRKEDEKVKKQVGVYFLFICDLFDDMSVASDCIVSKF